MILWPVAGRASRFEPAHIPILGRNLPGVFPVVRLPGRLADPVFGRDSISRCVLVVERDDCLRAWMRAALRGPRESLCERGRGRAEDRARHPITIFSNPSAPAVATIPNVAMAQ